MNNEDFINPVIAIRTKTMRNKKLTKNKIDTLPLLFHPWINIKSLKR